MKLRTPFTILQGNCKDIDYIDDMPCALPQNKQKDYWERECDLHATKSACKLYEV